MSYELRDRIWEIRPGRGLAASDKAVLLALATFANRKRGNVAYPKVDTLADLTLLSRGTVKRALKTLRLAGFVRVVKPAGQHGATVYGFVDATIAAAAADRDATLPGLELPTDIAPSAEAATDAGDEAPDAGSGPPAVREEPEFLMPIPGDAATRLAGVVRELKAAEFGSDRWKMLDGLRVRLQRELARDDDATPAPRRSAGHGGAAIG